MVQSATAVVALFLAVGDLRVTRGDEVLVDASGDAWNPLPTSVMHGDDECSPSNSDGRDSVCSLNALQMRASPLTVPKEVENEEEAVVGSSKHAVKSQEVLTWEQLKNVVEGSKTGARIHIPKGLTLTFMGTINIQKGTAFDIRSEGATLDAHNKWGRVRMFYVRGSLSLTGFVLENGKTDYAGAIYFDFKSHGRIMNCEFRNNEATYMGGAIVAKGAEVELTNVNFRANSAHNTCLSKLHCSRRRRNGRRANAVYVLSHSRVVASLRKQPRKQDFFFDQDFDGRAVFHCSRPRMEATDHIVARKHVKIAHSCNLTKSIEA